MSNLWHHLNNSDNPVPCTCDLFDQKNSEFQFSQRLITWNYSNFKSCAVLQTFHTTKECRHSEGELCIFYEYFSFDFRLGHRCHSCLQHFIAKYCWDNLLWFIEIINQNVNFCWIKVCLGAKINMYCHTVPVFSQVLCFLVRSSKTITLSMCLSRCYNARVSSARREVFHDQQRLSDIYLFPFWESKILFGKAVMSSRTWGISQITTTCLRLPPRFKDYTDLFQRSQHEG